MPKISIIVPVYKAEKTLVQCVDSILGQSFADFELILVDDGSPDNSPEFCDEYAKKDSRIKVIHKENGGVSSARNAGIEKAQGEYICFVDSDDYVLKNHISSLLNTIETNNSGLAVAPVILTYNNVQSNKKLKNETISLSDLSKENMEKIFDSAVMHGPNSKLYRADIVKNNHLCFMEDVHWGEDTIFVYSYLRFSNTVSYINTPSYVYCFDNSVGYKKYWPNLPHYAKQRFIAFLDFINSHEQDEFLKKEIISFCSISSFKIAVYKKIFKESFFRFIKTFNTAYKYYSPYFNITSFITDDSEKFEMKLLSNNHKISFFIYMHIKLIKSFLKNKFGFKKKGEN